MQELYWIIPLAIYCVLCFVVCPRLSEIVMYIKKIYDHIKDQERH